MAMENTVRAGGSRYRNADCPRGVAGHAGMRRDRHQPSARRQHGERRADVAQAGVVAAALHAGAHRERGVHEHHGRHEAGQIIGDVLGVVAVHGDVGEEVLQKARPGRGEFVEVELLGGGLAQRAPGHDGQHPGARRGLQHPVAGADHGRLRRGIGERQGGRELLQADLFLGAARVGRFQRRQAFEHREHGGGTAWAGARLPAHRHSVTLDEQDDGGFGGVVGVLPDPGALGVGAAERAGERVAQDRRR